MSSGYRERIVKRLEYVSGRHVSWCRSQVHLALPHARVGAAKNAQWSWMKAWQEALCERLEKQGLQRLAVSYRNTYMQEGDNDGHEGSVPEGS